MRVEPQRVALVANGPLGGIAMSLVRALPPGPGRKAANLFWKLGLLKQTGGE